MPSVNYRIAIGPHAGRKALTLYSVPPMEERSNSPLVAKVAGFSLHAGTVCETYQRSRLERLCRYITRPPVATKRLSLGLGTSAASLASLFNLTPAVGSGDLSMKLDDLFRRRLENILDMFVRELSPAAKGRAVESPDWPEFLADLFRLLPSPLEPPSSAQRAELERLRQEVLFGISRVAAIVARPGAELML